jgi:glycine C-acetyltransferase
MFDNFAGIYDKELEGLKQSGFFKNERLIASSQSPEINLKDGSKVLNLCANNYLGLADNPEIIQAAIDGMKKWGYGMASVRFICGTQEVHRELEKKISSFLGTDETILYSSCFDANGGLFETLLGPEDAIISDELNHASIIDGVRLCKAERFRYRNCDIKDLEAQLVKADNCRIKLIATDGVFSMDGTIAPLKEICDLAEKYNAMVMVDDSHAAGFLGANGRGTPEYCGVEGRVDIITGTLGKALGGASGGYTSGRKQLIEFLRQKSRPYLFSNSLAPPVVSASLKALDLVVNKPELRDKLTANTSLFRKLLKANGFDIPDGTHPIIPVMLGDALLAQRMSEKLLEKGVYAIGFCYPVVPKGKARIRTQISAAHTTEELEFAAAKFAEARDEVV